VSRNIIQLSYILANAISDIMPIDYQAKQFDMDTVAKAAGCPSVQTLATWRNRGGLFKETVTGTKHSKFFSVIDVCIVRVVRLLTAEHGFSAQDAISLAPEFYLEFLMALEDGGNEPRLVGLHKGSRDPNAQLSCYFLNADRKLPDLLSATPGGVITIFDVRVIISDVMAALKLKRAKPK
jgi:hypothetical protein